MIRNFKKINQILKIVELNWLGIKIENQNKIIFGYLKIFLKKSSLFLLNVTIYF